jgi:hypothetical protein
VASREPFSFAAPKERYRKFIVTHIPISAKRSLVERGAQRCADPHSIPIVFEYYHMCKNINGFLEASYVDIQCYAALFALFRLSKSG